ncbi:MAG TPA: hypothetical protein DDY49_03005 [Paenibacillaceae bacterium]|nr:hypothetical protein [Paenibacillaceae bacterium]
MENRASQSVIMEMVSYFGIQEDEPESHREKYPAQLHQKGNHWFISFQEEQGPSLLKISENEITVIRRGQVTMRQPFRTGVLTSGTYINPTGKMFMETHTHEIICEKDTQGEFLGVMWRYDLRLNGQEVGQNRVTCYIRRIEGLEE